MQIKMNFLAKIERILLFLEDKRTTPARKGTATGSTIVRRNSIEYLKSYIEKRALIHQLPEETVGGHNRRQNIEHAKYDILRVDRHDI